MYYPAYGKKKSFVFGIACFLIVLLTVIMFTNAKVQPAVNELAALEAKASAERKINAAVESVLNSSADECSDIIKISYNDNGTVKGISADVVKLNYLKVLISDAVDKSFRSGSETVVRVPLGSASDIPFLTGQGPYKKVKVGYSACVSADFNDEFASVGTNQLRYNIYLRLTVDMVILLPGKKISKTVNSSFCIAHALVTERVAK